MPLAGGDVDAGLTAWGTGVAVGIGGGTDDGTAAPGASATSCGGAGAVVSLSRYTWLPPLGGLTATITSGGVVLATAMASTFQPPLGRPVSALWYVRPPSVERKKSPPVLPPESAPA